jgi:hypothetical protein
VQKIVFLHGQPGTAAVQQYNFALRDSRKTVSADTVLSFLLWEMMTGRTAIRPYSDSMIVLFI